MTFTFQPEDLKRDSSKKMSHQHLFPLAMEEDVKTADTKKANRVLDHEKENTRSICLLEQKRKVVSSNIDVPPASICGKNGASASAIPSMSGKTVCKSEKRFLCVAMASARGQHGPEQQLSRREVTHWQRSLP
ncbi:hypothetical protein CB1_002519010 [Camelus ferus]|nr:hypothetical protein CB1_002519010 [Camelus ferus]